MKYPSFYFLLLLINIINIYFVAFIKSHINFTFIFGETLYKLLMPDKYPKISITEKAEVLWIRIIILEILYLKLVIIINFKY